MLRFISEGEFASITENSLSDGSKTYDVRVGYAVLRCASREDAEFVFEVLESGRIVDVDEG